MCSIMKAMKIFVLLCVVLGASSEFFHEPSRIKLQPSGVAVENSYFGFSLAYQDSTPARLVVGAPLQDSVGMVYNCPLTDFSNDINCSKIDMTSLQIETKTKKAREKINPKQKYFFGSTLAASSDYFLTCAPLLTKTINSYVNEKSHTATDAFGACYIYNNTLNEYVEWMDNGVRLEDTFSEVYKLMPKTTLRSTVPIKAGGTGWSSLADPDGFLMAAKTAYPTDVLFVDVNHPLNVTMSLVEKYIVVNNVYGDNYNLGYGITVGNFFDRSVKLYAVSSRSINLKGKIMFLVGNNTSGGLDILSNLEKTTFEPYYINNAALGAMFGYALGAADLNQDGLSELLVGAPAQADSSKLREFGALHIYVGGDLLSRNDKKRMRTVLADKEDSRFGSAIATKDIDGDNIPEIFVSAIHENFGSGAVYVISGYEVRETLFKDDGFKLIRLSELKLTQEIRGDIGSKLFGFSLQIVKDVDKNGCDELAIGSPASSSVRLLRCLPAVNTTIALKLIGDEIVSDEAKNFKIMVCLKVTINAKCESAIGNIVVSSSANGHTSIKAPSFTYVVVTKERTQEHCEEITVDLTEHLESAEYTFTTNLDVDITGRGRKDYQPWAVLSPYSEKEKSIIVKRYCTSNVCKPILTYEMYWSGGEFINSSLLQDETVTIQVSNTGHDANSVYLKLVVQGAPITSALCVSNDEADTYICTLPTIKRNSPYNMTVLLNMFEPINSPALSVTAELYNEVFPDTKYDQKHMEIEYVHDTNSVWLNGSRHDLNVTDKDFEDSNIVTFSDNHEYYISNNGPVTWVDLRAILEITNDFFIVSVKTVTTEVCKKQHTDDISKIIFHCQMTLKPGAVKKIVASIEVSKKKLENDIGRKLSLNSTLSLLLLPDEELHVKSSSQIIYKEILTFANKRWLIIVIVVIVALIVLILLVLILYKYGFFKRQEKKKLSVLRDSIRKRSIRKASEGSRSHKPSTADGDHFQCDMEVVDDCAFQEDLTPDPQTKDDVVLIEEKAEVHT